jgi:membrane-anchored protein YejM (alkaline phosphatase superfamily)
MPSVTRGALFRWMGWFAAANALVCSLVGLRYLAFYGFPSDALGLVYTVLAYAGQFALLSALSIFPLGAPLILIWPRRALVLGAAALAAAVLVTVLVLDANVFAQQRYHLTVLTAVLFEASTWILVGLIGVAAVLFELLLAGVLWTWVQAAASRGGVMVAVVLVASWTGGQLIYMWADAAGVLSVTQFSRYLPAYFPIHARGRLARLGLVDEDTVRRQDALSRARGVATGQLNYPLNPLHCAAAADSAPNLLFILFDGLRPDVIDARLLPHTAALRAEAQAFDEHYSGGNSSRMGIFSFFYGLPSSYFEAFYGVQRPPVLMDEIRRRGFDVALYSMPGFRTPTDTDRTAFAGSGPLPGDGPGTAISKNRQVTKDWLAWIEKHDTARPFMGFLYYDPPIHEMNAEPSPALPQDERFTANPRAREAWRRYRLAAQFVDAEVGRVVDSLRTRALLERTVVVLFSDHGNEFDDLGLGLVGHGSDFGRAQLRATLLMRWPGRTAKVYGHRTSHYDVLPTLMREVFGCTNPVADYSVGRSVFDGVSWSWLIARGYVGQALVQPDRVIVTSPGGFVELLGPDYRPLPGGRLDARIIEESMREMRRFYR